MAEEFFASSEELDRAEMHLCIFPHLAEFLVLDLRRELPDRPCARVLFTGELFSDSFYHEIEQAFSALLRQKEHPFASMMELPKELEALIRREGLSAILEKVNADVPQAGLSQIAILLCTGSMLDMKTEEVGEVVRRLVGSPQEPSLVAEATEQMARLLKQEGEELEKIGREHRRQAIWGRADEFFTLWENRG